MEFKGMREFDLVVQKFGIQVLNGFWHGTEELLQYPPVERPRLGLNNILHDNLGPL
jgi:hypothetical protein